MARKKQHAPGGPWWKKLLRTLLISVGTALVVKMVDALLYPQERPERQA